MCSVLHSVFDEIASSGNGAIGDKEMSMLLKDDIVAGKSHMASVKRKGGRGRQLSIRHSGKVGESIVKKLQRGKRSRGRNTADIQEQTENGAGPDTVLSTSTGAGLGFDDFKDAFQDMIDDDGESIRLPKIVRAQMQALNEEIRSLYCDPYYVGAPSDAHLWILECDTCALMRFLPMCLVFLPTEIRFNFLPVRARNIVFVGQEAYESTFLPTETQYFSSVSCAHMCLRWS